MSRLAPGDKVRVREDFPPGHIRTPIYLRGKTGEVVSYFGMVGNPEVLAYNLKGPPKELYKISFHAIELWPNYRGPSHDLVEADIYEHWLEKIS
jgi:hypothetical protein